jgi:PAS domain S-box-containing protein
MRFSVPGLSPNSSSTPQKSEAGHLSRSDKIVRRARHVSEANIIWRYSGAVLAVAAAAGLRLAFHRVLGLQVPYWSFTAAVMVAAWVGGRGPSLAATALSALTARWLFIAPTHSFAIADPAAAWGLGLFVITVGPIALMIVSLREALLAGRENEARFEFVLNAAKLGAWDLDLVRHTVWSAPQHEAIYGYPATTRERTWETYLAQLLPEDRKEIERRFQLAVITGTDFDSEYRIRRVDGAVRWIWAQGRILRYENGLPVHFSGVTRDITDQKMAQEALRENVERLQFVLDAAKLGAWELNLVDHTVRRAGHFDEIFGYTHSLPEWSYEKFLEHVLPEDRDEFERKLQQAAASGADWQHEFRIRMADGALRWICTWGRSHSGEGRMYGVNQDITERKQAEERLRESEERLRLAQQVARLGTFEWDLQTGVDRWTPELEALYGLPPGGFAGTEPAWEELVHPADRAEAVRRVQRALDTGITCDAEYRVIQPNGSVRWLYGRARMLKDDAGKPQRLIGVNMDITERKQAEERLRQIQKLESIGRLAGGIAHDFNNLLTVIIGNASFALTKYPSIEEIQHIITASERAAQLTSQLLAYAGKGQFISNAVNLSDLISRSKPLLSASIPKRVNLVFRLSQEELVIKADPSQIEQILMNLVINAAEAIPSQTDGRIEIVTGPSVVSPEMADLQAPGFDVSAGHFVLLEVTDNGSGMDEATVAQIFEPFFSTKFTGRGLGLAAVQGILRSCNGFINVRSSPGTGSTFRVYLPASAEKAAAAIPSGARPDTSRRRDRKPATILVVDDEEMVRSMARTALQSEGYEVLEANNGRDALDMLARADTLPTLVLLDLTMPVMGGAELMPILNHDYPGLRVIVTSGYSEEDARSDLPPGVVADFLQKPYSITTLAEKVQTTLNSGGPDENVRKAA